MKPMNKWMKRAGISIAHGFEYYDIAVYSAIQTFVALNFFPQSAFGEHAFIFAWFPFILRFLSRPFGGFFVGIYADKYGRRAALIFTSALTGVATLLMSLLPTYDQIGILAPLLFFLMQLLQAFCFGGENPAAIAYLFEDSKESEQSRIGSFLWGAPFLSIALSLGAVACVQSYCTVEQMQSFGWRIPVLLGVINIWISYYFRSKLIESDKFVKSKFISIQFLPTLKIFLLYVPASILFYGNTISSKFFIGKFTEDPDLKIILPIIFNLLFFIACIVLSYLVDRFSSGKATLKKVYIMVAFLSVPVYALQAIDHWGTFIISQCFITLFVALTSSITPSEIFHSTVQENRITTIGLGINLGVIFIGGFVPMVVSILSGYGQAYVGLLMSCGSLFYFSALFLDRYIYPSIPKDLIEV
tara:strand:+ start:2836 stop:4080 length:1245 start_codon:yes stop_codon:yes gene_type:complete